MNADKSSHVRFVNLASIFLPLASELVRLEPFTTTTRRSFYNTTEQILGSLPLKSKASVKSTSPSSLSTSKNVRSFLAPGLTLEII